MYRSTFNKELNYTPSDASFQEKTIKEQEAGK